MLSNPRVEAKSTARKRILYIPRIEADVELNARFLRSQGETRLQPLGSTKPLAFRFATAALLETLVFDDDGTVIEPTLEEDEVEIKVKASAINSRDVTASAGTIDDHNLGNECAGIILRTGSRVKEFEVGDRVVTRRPGQGAHRTTVRNPTSLCHKIGTCSFTVALRFLSCWQRHTTP